MCDCFYEEELEEWKQLQKIKKTPNEREAEPSSVNVITQQ